MGASDRTSAAEKALPGSRRSEQSLARASPLLHLGVARRKARVARAKPPALRAELSFRGRVSKNATQEPDMTRNRPPSHEEGQRMNLDTHEREGEQPPRSSRRSYGEGPARQPREGRDRRRRAGVEAQAGPRELAIPLAKVSVDRRGASTRSCGVSSSGRRLRWNGLARPRRLNAVALNRVSTPK